MFLFYGCWCYLKTPGKGWGKPVNQLDTACRKFQQCQKCIKIDYSTTKNCDTSGFPISPILSAVTLSDSEIICKQRYRYSECSYQKCRCEAVFYRTILKVFFKNDIDENWSHEKFDAKNECQPVVTGRKDWKCCGRYPDRKPYNYLTRSCREKDL